MMPTENKVHKEGPASKISKNPGNLNPEKKDVNRSENSGNFPAEVLNDTNLKTINVPGSLFQQNKVSEGDEISMDTLKNTINSAKLSTQKDVQKLISSANSGDSDAQAQVRRIITTNNFGDCKSEKTTETKRCAWMLEEAWEPEAKLPVKISKVVLQAMCAMSAKKYHSLRTIKSYLQDNSNVDVPAMDNSIKSFIKWACKTGVLVKDQRKYKIPSEKEKIQLARKELKRKLSSAPIRKQRKM